MSLILLYFFNTSLWGDSLESSQFLNISLSNSQDEEEGTIPTITPKTVSSVITDKQKKSHLKGNTVIFGVLD